MDSTKNLSPLDKLIQLTKEAEDFGFDWPNEHMIVDQAISECYEIKRALQDQEPAENLQKEVGDLFHAAINLCMFAKFDVEETLEKAVEKFRKRLAYLKEVTKERGLASLQGQSIEFLLELWDEAKKRSQP